MKFVKATLAEKFALRKEAEIVVSPDDSHSKCLKIGNDYYNFDLCIMKYSKKEKCWIGVDDSEIIDNNYCLHFNDKLSEVKSPLKKVVLPS